MADPINSLKVGDPFPTSKRFWDPVLQTVAAIRAGQTTPQPQPPDLAAQWVKNTSEAPRKRYEVLGIVGPLFEAEDDAREIGDLTFEGTTPTADHVGRFVVLSEPCGDGKIAACKVDGVAKVFVEITDDHHRFADVLTGDASKLTSRDYGGAEILYRKSGTGTRLCWVRLVGAVAAKTRRATLTEDLVGSGTAAATLDDDREIDVRCYLLDGGTLPEGTIVHCAPQPDADPWIVYAVDTCKS